VWSALTEPGDGVAGRLIAGLGAARALSVVVDALDGRDGHALIVAACRESTPELSTPALPSSALQSSALEGPASPSHELADPLLLDALGPALERWSPRMSRVDVGAMLTATEQVRGRLVLPGDRAWPTGLDDLGPHAPHLIWVRSAAARLEHLGADGLAVVGSRANTVYGAEATAEVVSAAADAGVTVVSGGAYGIDAVAHRVALAGGTPTVVMLAGGIDQLYPVGNVELFRSVVDGGAVVAESPPGTRPSRWRFLQRNRAIAAVSAAVVVVEAGHRSGALNTAHHAAQLGRPVAAVPGPITSAASAGCHRLVAEGRAALLCRPADALAMLRCADSAPMPLDGPADDPLLIRVLDALSPRRGTSASEAARLAGVTVTEATDSLTLAELVGSATRTSGGWRRT
jgi:DNA processing protein